MIRSMKLFWRRVRGREPVMGAETYADKKRREKEDMSMRIVKNLKARRDSGEILSRTSEQYLADKRSEE